MERAFPTYVAATKPGIICGNLLTCAAGFAWAGSFDLFTLIPTLFGLSCIIAAGCVFNNIIDRNSDAKMARTQNRPLATGLVTPQSAALFATALAATGTLLLALFTHPLPTLLALLGLFSYLALYTPLKYRTPHATLIGSIAGALPPVVGYTATTHTLDATALLLFLLLVFWQMPHFYAIALYRMKEYAAASIPVFPIAKGVRTTQIHMVLYLLAFTLLAFVFTPFSLLFTLPWLLFSFQNPTPPWPRRMFLLSLLAIFGTSALLFV